MRNFSELAAIAIANAQSDADLRASRTRVVAAADEARRRIERDLHDGTQQRLVTIGLDSAGSRPCSRTGWTRSRNACHVARALEEPPRTCGRSRGACTRGSSPRAASAPH